MAFDVIFKGNRALPTQDYPTYGYTPSFKQKTLSFEMNLNLETVDRDVYNALDWIRELGGFQRGMRTICGLALIILTYQNYEAYMVSQLFERPKEKSGQDKKTSKIKTSNQGKSKKTERQFEPLEKVNPIMILFFDCFT